MGNSSLTFFSNYGSKLTLFFVMSYLFKVLDGAFIRLACGFYSKGLFNSAYFS
jgi:hypothetical protein